MPSHYALHRRGRSALFAIVATLLACTGFSQSTAPEAIVGERLIPAEWPVAVRPASHAEDETNLLIICHSGLVMWYDEETGERLLGSDTTTRVTIIDDDKPGQIAFNE